MRFIDWYCGEVDRYVDLHGASGRGVRFTAARRRQS